MEACRRIGIFDSGLGGLTVLKALRETIPDAQYVYLGDTARFPYGSKSPETIKRYAKECAQFLLSQEVGSIVLACNTVSALAYEDLCRELPCPVFGTISASVNACLENLEDGSIGIIGTTATIDSGVYERLISSARPDVKILSKACPLFVPFVEEGLLEGSLVEQVIDLYLSQFRREGVKLLLLGCTHYPLLSGALARYLGSGVKIIDCSKALALEVSRHPSLALQQKGVEKSRPKGALFARHHDQFFITDQTGKFNYLAAEVLGEVAVKVIKLED